MIYTNSKINKNNQISIPSEIRKMFDVKADDIVEWRVDDDGEIKLKFRKKVTFDDVRGFIKLDYKTDAVELEKELYE